MVSLPPRLECIKTANLLRWNKAFFARISRMLIRSWRSTVKVRKRKSRDDNPGQVVVFKMAEFLQYTVNGLIAGSAYGLLALAMTLIYGILSVPNFALGAIYALGAFISFYVIQWLGPTYYLLSLIPVILLASLLGIVTEKIIFRPLHDASHAAGFIGALGLYSILEGGWSVLFGPSWRDIVSPYNDIIITIGSVSR